MTPYDFVHLTLYGIGGTIRGRTKLQKTVYFLGIFCKNIDDLDYRPHFYGPYSDSVTDALNRLKSRGFVEESVASFGAIGKRGFEIARHDFRLTVEGRKLAEEKIKRNPDAWRKVKSAVDRFQKAGDLDYMLMSVAAKTLFMLKESGKPATADQLSKQAGWLAWKVEPGEINKSISYLRELNLVTTRPIKKPVRE